VRTDILITVKNKCFLATSEACPRLPRTLHAIGFIIIEPWLQPPPKHKQGRAPHSHRECVCRHLQASTPRFLRFSAPYSSVCRVFSCHSVVINSFASTNTWLICSTTLLFCVLSKAPFAKLNASSRDLNSYWY
jgi:hypothetical protein